MTTTKALRGRAISFRGNPFEQPAETCLVHHDDALVIIEGGVIEACGPYAELRHTLPDGVVPIEYPDAIICAGFIDAHVHYPQLQMIGAYGSQLLEWLETYTFVAEQQFADAAHAGRVAGLFMRELLRAGTTTAMVYCTVHPQSVDAFFAEAERFNARMIAGKVLMDRNAPDALLDSAQRGYDESKALIARWHGRGRQHYCVTPRFAPTSTEAQLDAAGALLKEHDGLFLQTHLCENPSEIAWVRELFPARASYLDVYAHAGLVGRRSMFGHAVHMHEQDFCTCHQAGAALAHCPTSNLFLGSGLFRLFDAVDPKRPVKVALGTDVGAGTSLSQLQSLNEAYKVAALTDRKLNATQAFYLATLGGAEALYLDDRLGKLEPGYDADLCILDTRATPLLGFRSAYCDSIEDLLFVLMTLGDDRAVRATYVAGECVYDRDRAGEAFRYPAATSPHREDLPCPIA
ncbi:guanine deaminase [Bosea caraganae]|uniref:Guanine deaminase n=1 Tax=Bosea caraganae TaxID=2763117 RepID=A0A370L940_9HYPH|nr:guanine deaminase [Bosea caraganae]RDJ26911.1 guanine deaminase [Bosea caraganae]RDJ30798.1 guanine deaminase [Bosea caraganae]